MSVQKQKQTGRPKPPKPLRSPDSATAKVLRHYIWRRMNVKNEHFMAAIVGREGFAKSHSMLKISSLVDPTFTPERVFFDPADLLEEINDNIAAGQMYGLDESGVGMGNRTWYNQDQILLNQAFQTIRDENAGIIFTLPRLSELDSQLRGRLHAFIEMVEKHEDEDPPYVRAKWKNIDPTRDETDKLYKKYPRLRWDGRQRRIRSIAFTPPDPKLVEEYEPRKQAFKQQFYEKAIAAARDGEDDDKRTPQEVADQIKEDGLETVVSVHGGNGTKYIDADVIEIEYGCSVRDAKKVKKILERDDDVRLTEATHTG